MKQFLILLGLSLTLLTTIGCHQGEKATRTLREGGSMPFHGPLPRGPVPTYQQLVSLHNSRLERIPQISAQAQIEIIYFDTKGKRHFEQADQCRLMFIRPRQMALLVRKFGVGDLFYAGSNNEHYWLFDLTNKDSRLLYQGRHDGDSSQAMRRLPVPVQPRDLPRLMGLAELPSEGEGSVAAVKGGYLVTAATQDWRILIDPASKLPIRVELLDNQQRVTMTSLLSVQGQVETYERAPSAWPKLMTRIMIVPHHSKDVLTVYLSPIDDGREFDTIQDRAFDLERLTRVYKPDEVILLDQPE
jgi:hypothetical protein